MTAVDVSWMADALCAETDPDLFLPDGQGTNNATAAKKICAQCDVIEECLAWALATGAEGTLGGMSQKERKKLRLARRKQQQARFSHGTRYGYSRGCRDETCPGDPSTGATCVEAERVFAKDAYKRRVGGAA